MKGVVVSDTTSLIVLEKLQWLDLLCHLFEQVIIPQQVKEELQAGLLESTKLILPPCFIVENTLDSKRLDSLLLLLDCGEAEAIALAAEKRLPLIIDERKGRQIANLMDIPIIGFAGLLVLAKRKNILKSAEALELLEQAMTDGLFLSNRLYLQVKAQFK